MNESFEDVVTEINSISEALDFISESIECHASEGKKINLCGLAYLTRLLGGRSSGAADSCWGICTDNGQEKSGGHDS
ncbi:hypothetical protein [Desulfovibrio sp. JC010]|uniref:hypothetical protein n=1 Tax=Desulfovibrio sp. JC010 TaxID=2593641 RepID=UPI0013D5BC81|nr:hypothetical protein [Desulfovibrio sp. JC010]NDV28245.1 hypothetical protein [Desulfovibrio sp. JC010]